MTDITLTSAPVTWQVANLIQGAKARGANGYVEFEASAVAVHHGGLMWLPSPQRVEVVDGTLEPISLPINDPEVWNWRVSPHLGVAWEPFHINVEEGGTDLASAAIVPGKGPVRVVQGPAGASIVDFRDTGDGALVLILSDGTESPPVPFTRGPAGPANAIEIGTVLRGDEPYASLSGEAPHQVLNLVLPKGDPGNPEDLVDATPEQRGLMSADDKAHLDETPAREEVVQKASSAIIAGPDAGGEFPAGFEPAGGSVVALGREAMGSMTDVKTSIAIGKRALGTGDKSRDNIAIGDDALYKTSSLSSGYTQTGTDGTRNIAIGGNAGRHIAHGVGHVAIGRNAGQNVVGGKGLVAIGNGAHASQCPIGLSGQIENWSPAGGTATQAYNVTVVGSSAGARISSGDATVFGADALRNAVKSSEVVAVGTDALRNVESGAWLNGMAYTSKNLTGTYVHDANTLTVTVAGHGAKVGDIALIRLTSGPSETFMGDVAPAEVVSVSSGAFVVAHPIEGSGTGDALLVGVADAAAAVPDGSQTTAVGAGSLRTLTSGRSNVAVGYVAGANLVEAGSSTLVGAQAGHGASGATATENTLVGFQAGRNVTSARYNTGIGYRALNALTTGEFNVGVGYNAGRYMVSGATAETVTNTTAIGYLSRVSGDNQVQLGNTEATTYVYGTVQNRSDLRDKADVRDTELGLDFVNALRPVDFRWDMREDYEDGARDGSKKRTRFHHGVIAQEVRDACEAAGVEFGGLQDHSLNGGDDVLSIGYDEMIGPLIKAVQELAAQTRELSARLRDSEA